MKANANKQKHKKETSFYEPKEYLAELDEAVSQERLKHGKTMRDYKPVGFFILNTGQWI